MGCLEKILYNHPYNHNRQYQEIADGKYFVESTCQFLLVSDGIGDDLHGIAAIIPYIAEMAEPVLDAFYQFDGAIVVDWRIVFLVVVEGD